MTRMAATTDTAYKAARTLDALRRHYHLSDQKLADRLGAPYTRSTVTDRRLGRTAIDANDMDSFGRALKLPPTVFLMDAGEAIRYALDHGPEPEDPRPTRRRRGPDLGGQPSAWKHGPARRHPTPLVLVEQAA